MTVQAAVTMVLVLLSTWGLFAVLLGVAYRKERRKKQAGEPGENP